MIQYALLVGMLAAFNPCGAPLLPAYLGLFSLSDGGGSTIGRTADGLRAGSMMSLGFLAVFAAVGLPLSALAAGLRHISPEVTALLGVGIVVAAIITLRGGAVRLPGRLLRLRGGRGAGAMVSFGMLYAIGSLSCELPLFIAATSIASTRSWVTSVLAVAAYAVGMGLVVMTLSVVVAVSGHRARRMRLARRWVRPVAATVSIAAGLFVTAVAIAEIADPSLAERLTQPFLSGQTALDGAVSTGPVWWATGLAVGLALLVVIRLATMRKADGRA
ncbi:cytochrome c biogenesis CcdA family protein [Pseudolysinimonas sp.]|uniref:cytochrome c biogenesis CcdA family protein n=1 Tax=Pseudolysinimonas sp. TaxID=2680009 RepID=UPI003F7DB936